MNKIKGYNSLLSEYNTLINLVNYYSKYTTRLEEIKKQIPDEYFNKKSIKQVKSDFKNVINNLLKNNDHNIIFRSFYFIFSLDIYIMTQNDTDKKDLNKLTKEEQLNFINRTIDYLLSFYKYNNLIIRYYDKDNFSLLKLEMNDAAINMINSNKDLYRNIQSFILCCKNFYKIKQQFIRNYTNYDKHMCFYDIEDYYNPHHGDNRSLDLMDDYRNMLKSYYTKHMNFIEDNFIIVYICGDKLYHTDNSPILCSYNSEIFMSVFYMFYIFEIPYFNQYFVNTKYFNKSKYNKLLIDITDINNDNYITDLLNYYVNN